MKELSTTISSVLVYRNGARVVRTGKTELAKGEHIVKVGDITQYAQQDSFRVKGKGKAVLRGMDVKQTQRVHEAEGDAGDLKKQLRDLEKKKENLQDKLLVQQSRLSSLNAISSQFGEEFGKWYAAGESKIAGLAEFDKTTVKMVRSARKTTRKLQNEIKKLEDEIAALQFNIQQIHGTRRTETHTEALIRLDVKESSAVEIELTYQVDYAGWEPTYDVDIGDARTSVKRIAMVANNTLEDWEDVKLTVSTASARRVEAVAPSPYYVDVYRPRPTRAPKMRKKEALAAVSRVGEAMEMDREDGAIEEEPMEEAFAVPSETLSGTTVYDIPAEISISSGEDPHPVTLTLEEFDSRRLHYWNAVDMPEVVAQDEITNGDSVLLPGDVKVYASGDFIGETHLDLKAPR
ncbi:mucoidy inhibitor MuiA family protein, partial [Candidatus Thorarchaeota archaeon]